MFLRLHLPHFYPKGDMSALEASDQIWDKEWLQIWPLGNNFGLRTSNLGYRSGLNDTDLFSSTQIWPVGCKSGLLTSNLAFEQQF